jgi:hypothetical protein
MQQVEGCDALPATCSAACAPVLIEYFEGYQGIIGGMAPNEKQRFQELYDNCEEVEQTTAAMLQDARPAMIFHVVVMDEAAAQQPSPSPSSPPLSGGAEIAQEFRRVCTTGNLATCVPQCNAPTYGFLLSISIDGRGTVLTCNKIDGKFS